jgi:STE24 endopeptidase
VGCGPVGLTRAGERVAVRPAFGSASPAHAMVLQPVWAAALRLSGTAAGKVDLYVQPAGRLNVYAADGRSVAVTTRVLEDYWAGLLSQARILTVLVHELGHHVTGGTPPMLIAMWFAAPWRVTAGLLTGLAGALSWRPAARTI